MSAVSSAAASAASSIPDISWRLVMQLLTIGDRLKLSRCSSSLLRAGCSPFAWRGVTLSIETSEAARLARLSKGRVLQHIPLSLSIHSLLSFAQLCALLNGALARSVLRGLDARDCSTELAWPHILAQPQMEHLRVLYLSGLNRRTLVDPALARLIAALPSLETLHVPADALPSLRHPQNALPASFPALRSLQLSSAWPQLTLLTRALHTAFCVSCPNQTELSLEGPPLTQHTFLPTFMEPHITRIKRLRLYRMRANYADHPIMRESDLPAALANMRSMHTLVIERSANYSLWMRNLQHAPALELFEFTCRDPGRSDDLPSVAEIAAMLTACPRLRFRWTLQPNTDRPDAEDRKHWLKEKNRYKQAPTLVQFGLRFMMLDCAADVDDEDDSAPNAAKASSKACVLL